VEVWRCDCVVVSMILYGGDVVMRGRWDERLALMIVVMVRRIRNCIAQTDFVNDKRRNFLGAKGGSYT